MRILMFGWEFPPNSYGGLGMACYGLTRALTRHGCRITMILPQKNPARHILTLSTDAASCTLKHVDAALHPYLTSAEYARVAYHQGFMHELYGHNLFEEVQRYTLRAISLASKETFDIIHCHDWMTFRAGLKMKEISKKPLLLHVHSTDFDRTGGNQDSNVYKIEKEGMERCDRIIAVSNYTKNMIVRKYHIPEGKISVIHNAIDYDTQSMACEYEPDHSEKIVLFLGRLTIQKGPDYFIETASRVLKLMPDVRFIIVGTGDLYPRLVDRAIELGMARNVLFTGHLRGDDVKMAYRMADLYVMPSVSEPFGLTPLEALNSNTPVIISKQSGVREVLRHAMAVDFWDTEELANKIVAVLSYGALKSSLLENGLSDIKSLSWDRQASECVKIYLGMMLR